MCACFIIKLLSLSVSTFLQGGNDFEIYMDERTKGHKVTSPEDTMQQLKGLFF